MMRSLLARSVKFPAVVGWMVATLAVVAIPLVASPASAAAPGCSETVRASYTATVCFATPQGGATLTGVTPVSVTVTVTGNNPGVRRVDVTLDGQSLLTDVAGPYNFDIPSAKYVDGSKILTVQATLRDDLVTVPASIAVTFSNGVVVPPTNPNTFTPHAPSGTHGRLVATGDGAGGRPEAQAVASSIAAMNPDVFVYLGDVYERGTITEMYNWYGHDGSYFNALHDITNPVIGNHEYDNGSAPGYFDYWDNIADYYSYDALGWHFIALNSDSHLGQYGPGTPQYDWLVQDLASSSSVCTVAYWHHPRFSVGPQSNSPEMQPIWQLLADNGADLVLSGHEHSYQRFERLNGAGNPDPNGILSIVAGAGGHGVQSFVTTDPRLVVGIDTVGQEGSLRVDLNPAGAELAYVNKTGAVVDATTLACSGGPLDTSPPSTPTQPAAVASSGTQVDLSWSPSQDDVAVTGYTVYRDGLPVATVDGPNTTYIDLFLDPNTTYGYQIDAFDAAGNHSPLTAVVPVTTPDAPTSYGFGPIGDSYVNGSSPTTGYGSASLLRIDSSPDMRSYLGFEVTGVVGAIQGSTLRVWANSSSGTGFEVRAVPAGSWSESTINYNNAPVPGTLIGSSGPFAAGVYVDVALGGFVAGDGPYSLVLTPLSSSGISLASRESATPPRLDVAVTPAGNVAPVAADITLAAEQGASTGWVPVVDDANGDTLSCSIGTPPANGQASVATDCSSGTYQSGAGYAGPDLFTYVVSDGQATDTGQVDVTVNSAPAYGPNPTADAFVDSSKATTNYGSSTQLRTDSSPDIRSYLQFGVNPLQGPVTSAKLRIRAATSLTAGFEVHAVANNGWDESAINYNNAPAVGGLIATSGPVSAGSWIEIDVSSQVTSAGLYSFALTPLSTTNLRLDSRESTNPPQLVIQQDVSGNSPPTAGNVAVATPEDTPAPWNPAAGDPDQGDVLTCSIVALPAKGVATVASDCSSGSYAPNPNLNGPDTFTYQVSDGTLTAVGTVDVSITAVNDVPVAGPVNTGTVKGVPVVVSLSGADADGECPLTFTIASGPAAGVLGPITNVQCTGGVAGAQVTYTPNSGATGIDTFTYVVADPSLATSSAATVNVEVTAPQTSFTFNPVADAYVDSSAAATNFGSSTQLRTDSSPDIRSYLRFAVAPLPGPVTSAKLRIRAGSTLAAGFEIRIVADNGWGESTIVYNNAPAVGSLIAASGPVSNGAWIEINVSSYVTGSGSYSFALTPLSTTNLRLDSRETATRPELVIET